MTDLRAVAKCAWAEVAAVGLAADGGPAGEAGAVEAGAEAEVAEVALVQFPSPPPHNLARCSPTATASSVPTTSESAMSGWRVAARSEGSSSGSASRPSLCGAGMQLARRMSAMAARAEAGGQVLQVVHLDAVDRVHLDVDDVLEALTDLADVQKTLMTDLRAVAKCAWAAVAAVGLVAAAGAAGEEAARSTSRPGCAKLSERCRLGLIRAGRALSSPLSEPVPARSAAMSAARAASSLPLDCALSERMSTSVSAMTKMSL
ncbi:hypothetical protein TSOC_010643, partial [Tetrabaena socialis]